MLNNEIAEDAALSLNHNDRAALSFLVRGRKIEPLPVDYSFAFAIALDLSIIVI